MICCSSYINSYEFLSLFPLLPSVGNLQDDWQNVFTIMESWIKVPSKNYSLPPCFTSKFLRAPFHVSRVIGSTIQEMIKSRNCHLTNLLVNFLLILKVSTDAGRELWFYWVFCWCLLSGYLVVGILYAKRRCHKQAQERIGSAWREIITSLLDNLCGCVQYSNYL